MQLALNISPLPLREGARSVATRGRGLCDFPLPQTFLAALEPFAPSREGRG
jgi:hypothetical protein